MRTCVAIASPFSVEREAWEAGHAMVAGVDEVGRGPLAGPVVAAAVILPRDFDPTGIGDSKAIKEAQREVQCERIQKCALAVGVGRAEHYEIDEINILQASLLAMRRAVENLGQGADYLIVDGRFRIPVDLPQLPLVHGDALCVSVAAASIVAKVFRDRLMAELDEIYPVYGFARHKGYPTKSHYAAIGLHGPSPVHRLSFRGVKD
ncbi:MAG: ribonuclease HII [Deltaproteobacteria bacterium]|nr:ribonuclease HII [Deltaproteobacteria bacterium]